MKKLLENTLRIKADSSAQQAEAVFSAQEYKMKDKRLEILSDKVRMGEPIGISDACEVIAYQEELKRKRKQSIFKRILRIKEK